jgi:Ferritin-like domain
VTFDEPRIWRYVEESQDLHSTATRLSRQALDEIVEVGRERRARGGAEPADPDRRGFLHRSLLAAGVIGGGALGTSLFSRITVAGAASMDVQMLQTAASLENLAVAVYTRAASLPPGTSGASIPLVKTFVATTIGQHTAHAQAFNAAAAALGGRVQTGMDTTVYNAVVVPALARITGPADVISLAIALEDSAAATYIRFGGTAADPKALQPFATVAPVEAQHAAVLRTVGALLAARLPQLIVLGPAPSRLPASAGSVGFPDTFFTTDSARSAAEGAVAG